MWRYLTFLQAVSQVGIHAFQMMGLRLSCAVGVVSLNILVLGRLAASFIPSSRMSWFCPQISSKHVYEILLVGMDKSIGASGIDT
jgi:hypothetical protein